MRALPITVYSNSNYRQCANGGISERYDELLLIHPEGFIEIDEENPPENLVKVVTRQLFGREYMHIEPVARPQHIGWMMGGSYAGSSDTRFNRISPYPLPIHDRQETREQNDLFFN